MSLQKEFYKSICDNILQGILVLDKNHTIQFWNRWLSKHTSFSCEEVVGKRLDELYPEHLNKRFTWAVDQTISTKSPQVMSQALNRFLIPIAVESSSEHSLPLMQQHINISPITGEGEEILAVVCIQDVTASVTRSSAMAELAQKLHLDSTRDHLTGIYNRRFLWDWLVPNLKYSMRHENPMACLIADIDHFKKINDKFGHDRGDEVIKSFSAVIADTLRDSDLLVRYGGEEFIVMMMDNDLEAGIYSAERILRKIRESSIASFEPGEITCSFGVAAWDPCNPVTSEELLKQADKHLYRAKDNGRNCVFPTADKKKTA